MSFEDENAEYRLLGTIIDRPDTVLGYGELLFTSDRRYLFNAMRRAYLTFGDISAEGVERFYGRMLPTQLEMGRGAKPSAILDRLEVLATKRQIASVQNELTVALAQRDVDRVELAKKMILAPVITREDSSLGPGVISFVSDLVRKREGRYRFAQTGLSFLDHMLGGEWPRQGLAVVSAQSGGGKTAIVVNSILNMARLGLPSLFISLEMPKDRIIGRMVANISGVDGLELRKGNITDEEQARVDRALEEIQSLDKLIYIVDKPGMSVEDILYQVKVHKENYNIDAFFVDYIQIVDRPKGDHDVEELGSVVQQLRNAAVELDIAAIALSQKNSNQGLESIWGSRRIVHIADTVLEIELDKDSTNDNQRMCQLNFLKNREGPTGTAHCLYYPKYLRFE